MGGRRGEARGTGLCKDPQGRRGNRGGLDHGPLVLAD